MLGGMDGSPVGGLLAQGLEAGEIVSPGRGRSIGGPGEPSGEEARHASTGLSLAGVGLDPRPSLTALLSYVEGGEEGSPLVYLRLGEGPGRAVCAHCWELQKRDTD